MQLAATFLNFVYSYSKRFTINWYTPLHLRPANQLTLTVVAISRNSLTPLLYAR